MVTNSNSFDSAARAWTLAHQTAALHGAALWVSRIGSVGPVGWAGVVVSMLFAVRGRRRAAVSALLAPILAEGAFHGIRSFYVRARPAGAAVLGEMSGSFPSAHSTMSAAVCCTIAFLLWREEMLSPSLAVALAVLVPLLIGLSRLVLDVHWASDVAAGWIIGTLIAALARVAYNRSPFFT